MSALLMYIASAWADVLHAAEDAAAVGLTRTMSELAVDAAAIVPSAVRTRLHAADVDEAQVDAALLSRTRWAADVAVVDAVLDADDSRTLTASDEVVDTPTTIDASSLTRTDAAAVVVVIIIVLAPPITAPSSP